MHPNILDFKTILVETKLHQVQISETFENEDYFHNNNNVDLINKSNLKAILFLTRFEIGCQFPNGKLLFSIRDRKNAWIPNDLLENGVNKNNLELNNQLDNVNNHQNLNQYSIQNDEIMQQFIISDNILFVTLERGLISLKLNILNDEASFQNNTSQFKWEILNEWRLEYPLIRIEKLGQYLTLSGEKFVIFDTLSKTIILELSTRDLISRLKFSINHLDINKSLERNNNYEYIYIQSMDLDHVNDNVFVALGTNTGKIIVLQFNFSNLEKINQERNQTNNLTILNEMKYKLFEEPFGKGISTPVTSVQIKDGWIVCGGDLGYGMIYRLEFDTICYAFVSNYPITNLILTPSKEIICSGYGDDILEFHINGKKINRIPTNLGIIFKMRCYNVTESNRFIVASGENKLEIFGSGRKQQLIHL